MLRVAETIAVFSLAHCAAPVPAPVRIETCSAEVSGAPASTDSTIYQWWEATPAPNATAVVIPQYPAKLAHRPNTARVVLLAVVDTAGRIEPGSIQLESASDTAFVAPSVFAVTHSVFCPGLYAGRRVRVRIRIPMHYSAHAAPAGP